MQINFNVPLVDDEGTEVKNPDGSVILLSSVVRTALKQEASHKDNVMFFGWCLELVKGKLDLDNAGTKRFKEWVEEPIKIPITQTETKDSSKFTALVHYRILEVLENATKKPEVKDRELTELILEREA